MKLLHGGLSPFVRKVMIVALEKGVADKLELVPTPVNPLKPLDSAIAVNPLGKIPALTLDDSTVLYGSTVVAEYLDALDAPRFFPQGADKWRALRLNALGDGILEAGNAVRIESLRPEEKQWDGWSDVQMLKVTNGLNQLEKETLSQDLTIGEVAVIAALGWLDVRLPQANWREGRPQLAAWFAAVSEKPSVAQTAPKLPK